MKSKRAKALMIALLFLLPNLLGFLIFTAGPVLFSLYMSTTDWALARHNDASGLAPSFVGFANYARLLWGDESRLFWDYFGNTVVLMLGIPIGIAGSLALALMLNVRAEPRTPRGRAFSVTSAAVLSIAACAGAWMISTPGPARAQGSALAELSTETGLTTVPRYEVERARSNALVLTVAVLGAVVTLGLALGTTFFRTVFYLPSLLAGVAMYLLWKMLYRPEGGLLNAGLEPVLASIESAARGSPPVLWHAAGGLLALDGAALSILFVARGLKRFTSGDSGIVGLLTRFTASAMLLIVTAGLAFAIVQTPTRALFATGWQPLDNATLRAAIDDAAQRLPHADRDSLNTIADQFEGTLVNPLAARAILVRAAARSPADEAVIESAVMSRTQRTYNGWCVDPDPTDADPRGLRPPAWLQDARWAKAALILMGVWLAIGGGNMLLYLAGLSNIPPELYEAAAIDGASGWTRFANVTWPQLAPTTFFIVIMSTIGGLQGGFEQAMVMTQGKYDTITLTYHLYTTAFGDRFELGLASAIAWVMFAMIFLMTLVNFRFGSRLTND